MLRTQSPPLPSVRMQPEAAVLLFCASAYVSGAWTDRFQPLLCEALDWDHVIQLAMHHGVLPLLYWHLNTVDTGAVPKETLTQLQSYFYANKLHTHRLTQTLHGLLRRFETQGITAIPFKGPTLALTAYGNLDLRQFGDLDILVPERDCSAAMQLLASQGFRLKSEVLDIQAEIARQSRCAYSFIHDADSISVDLHWGITAAMEYPDRTFALPLASIDVWKRVELISLDEASVLSFSPEDLFLILCIHGSKHCWERLSWLCDIAAFIRARPGMQWERIQANAQRLGCRRMLELGMLLVHMLLGVSLPSSVQQQVQRDAVVRSLARAVEQRLFTETVSETSLIGRSRFYLRMRERWRDKVQYGALLAGLAVRWSGYTLPDMLIQGKTTHL